MATQTQESAAASSLGLEEVAAGINEVTSLPHVAVRIISAVNNPNSSAVDIKNVLEMDPSLTARLLRVVNSALYRPRMEIRTIHHAIAYLGFPAVRNVALTSTVSSIFSGEKKVGSYSRKALWVHLVSVGLASRMIAARAGLADFEDAFLAGLLHDLGIMLLDQNFASQFVAVLELLDSCDSLCDAETRVFGFTHAELGATVARKWQLPSTVIGAMRHHHDADACSDGNKHIVQVVELANYLCSLKGISSVGNAPPGPPSDETLNSLASSRESFRVLWEDLDAELETAEILAWI